MAKINYDEKKVLMLCVIILIILFIVALSTTDFQGQYWNQQAQKVQRHYHLWAEQKITSYQIGIHWLGYPEDCTQEVTVANNLVKKITKNNCDHHSSGATMDDLFSLVRRPIDLKKCGVNGCDCDGPFVMDVHYDEKYGFPKKAKPAYHPEESWRFGEHNLFRPKICMMAGTLSVSWEIDSFLPLK